MAKRELFIIYRVVVPVPDAPENDDALNEAIESLVTAPELVFEMTPEYVGPVFEYTPPVSPKRAAYFFVGSFERKSDD